MSEAVQVTIDGRAVEVEAGQTVLHAARKLGLDIPTLCYLEKCGPLTSCLACVVKVKTGAGPEKLVPSCATIARPGMIIESETEDVRESRRTAMELLLSDHVGDCLSPCERLCPLRLPIPRLIRHIQSDRYEAAVGLMQGSLPLAGVISRLCHAPCENGCRRGTADESVAIRELERSVAEQMSDRPLVPPILPSSGKAVAIVGAGPAGLAAAFTLARKGHRCVVFDRQATAGGSLGGVEPNLLPQGVLADEISRLARMGVEFTVSFELGVSASLEGMARDFSAILLTVGELPKGEATKLGVAASATGIKTNAETYQTELSNVFAAGSAVRPLKQIVRAAADGVSAAECIHQFITNGSIRRAGKPFSSIMGRLDKPELELFLQQASASRRTEPGDAAGGYTAAEAAAEAARCVHCDCRAAGDCRLQRYAAQYGAEPGRFRAPRAPFSQIRQHANVIYEPGKCIRCGICVRVTELASEPLGLTFVGRGFEVQIAAPLSGTIAEALQNAAAECVDACPTGALCREDLPHVPTAATTATSAGDTADQPAVQ